jgi:RNA polymerase sigma-70 factor (ECF subfamily)
MAGASPAEPNGDDMTATIHQEGIIETAYAAQAGPLFRRLTATTRDPSAAEDLTQEAFVRLVLEIRAGRTPDDVGAWLHRVGHNLAMSRGRRIAVAGRHAAAVSRVGESTSPEAMAIESERDALVRDVVGELGAIDQRVLILAANGYRGPEIARSIGKSDAATRTLLCRARTKIRARLVEAGVG